MQKHRMEVMLLSDVKMPFLETKLFPYENYRHLVIADGEVAGRAGNVYEKGNLQHSWCDLQTIVSCFNRLQKKRNP